MIGIIGGTGIYDASLLKNAEEVKMHTPYGKPSDLILVGEFKGKKIAILSRHGKKHTYNPSQVNYRANIYALKQLGVTRIISACAVGSLQENIEPGKIVFVDQFIDRTYKRENTFYEGQQVCHISMAEPFCEELRKILIENAKELNIDFAERGCYVCIEGPRFSTKAESRLYKSWGCDIIGMTLCPEVTLAKEAELCYASVAMVTDYDTFKEDNLVSAEEVIKTMKENIEKVRKLLENVIPKIPEERNCSCKDALKGALM